MAFVFDRRSRKSYPHQFNEQLLAQVVVGRLALGARLPSVRALARGLRISRTTAHRIHESLPLGGVAEVRPRSGAFIVRQAGPDSGESTEQAQKTYEFLKEILNRAKTLGIEPRRLSGMLDRVVAHEAEQVAGHPAPTFGLFSTPDWFECVLQCLGENFPANVVHVSSHTPRVQVSSQMRYLLHGYFGYEEARRLAETAGCQPLFVRYNVSLFDRAMAVRTGEHRYFVTRDQDNAEATRTFLASAFPEVPVDRYSVWSVEQYLERAAHRRDQNETWVTITAEPYLLQLEADRRRLHLLHPLLHPDFVEKLRQLALVT